MKKSELRKLIRETVLNEISAKQTFKDFKNDIKSWVGDVTENDIDKVLWAITQMYGQDPSIIQKLQSALQSVYKIQTSNWK